MECPKSTAPQIYSYATTSTDDNGFSTPATAYELHCVNANGKVIKSDPVGYAFIGKELPLARAWSWPSFSPSPWLRPPV